MIEYAFYSLRFFYSSSMIFVSEVNNKICWICFLIFPVVFNDKT